MENIYEQLSHRLDDMATGYLPGQIRGAISLRKTLDLESRD